MSCIGGESMSILKYDIRQRLANLDPQKIYERNYTSLIKAHLGALPITADHPLTIIFAVGGAGAQKEIGVGLLKQFRNRIAAREMKIVLVAGIKNQLSNILTRKLKIKNG